MREPDAWDSVRVLAIVLILQALGGVLGDRLGMGPPARGGLSQALFLAVPLVYARAAGLSPLAANGLRPLGGLRLGLVLTASVGSLWLLKGLSELDLRVLTELGLSPDREVGQLNRAVGKAREQGGLGAVVVLVLLPAVCEEVFFRGLFFRGLARGLGPAWALGISTLLFAFWHEFWVQRVMMVFLGFYFGLVVWLTGSLGAGVLAHGVNNLAVLAVTALWGDRMAELRAPAGMMILSGAVWGLAIGLLVLERARESPTGSQGSEGWGASR